MGYSLWSSLELSPSFDKCEKWDGPGPRDMTYLFGGQILKGRLSGSRVWISGSSADVGVVFGGGIRHLTPRWPRELCIMGLEPEVPR